MKKIKQTIVAAAMLLGVAQMGVADPCKYESDNQTTDEVIASIEMAIECLRSKVKKKSLTIEEFKNISNKMYGLLDLFRRCP